MQFAHSWPRLLTRQNWIADEVSDGMEALSRIQNTTYDAIVLDLMLPRLPGDALLDEVRRSMPATLSRIVVVTASPAHARNLDPTGLAAVLTKPFDIDQLTAAVRACVERPR